MNIKPLEISIRELIEDGLLLQQWEDQRGRTQQPPVVQLYEFNEEDPNLSDNQLALVIKNSGSGTGDFLLREPAMNIFIMSDKQRKRMGQAKYYADLVKNHLSRNFRKDCIISVNIIGDVAGPYRLQSGRRYFDLNLQVITSTGVTE